MVADGFCCLFVISYVSAYLAIVRFRCLPGYAIESVFRGRRWLSGECGPGLREVFDQILRAVHQRIALCPKQHGQVLVGFVVNGDANGISPAARAS